MRSDQGRAPVAQLGAELAVECYEAIDSLWFASVAEQAVQLHHDFRALLDVQRATDQAYVRLQQFQRVGEALGIDA